MSVLVPVLDEAESIEATVAVMASQRFDGLLEFLFADGGSADGTRERLAAMARRDPRIRVLDNPLRGTASGLNVCLREARGTYVARMDGHTFYPPDYLARGVARLERGDVAWVAGPQLPEARGPVSQGVVDALASPLGRGASKKWAAGEAEFDLDTGVFCGVWRRADVLAHDGWDEGWPRNQDSEMAARFLRRGQRIVCVPAMAARYLPRDSARGLWRQYRGYGEYRARTALRHPTSLRRSALLPPLVVVDVATAVLAPSRPVRRLARVGAALYGLAIGAGAARTAREHGPARGLRVAQVLLTMHLAHGVGFFAGARRWGMPWRAVTVAAGLPPREAERAPFPGPVDAPSLAAATEQER
ncbi:glycosyltransferase [Baekduia alba]|uniref:glycosyltransferase n=1 Tax=Baekduia alba TaxID=2997333 RepID=UPI0023416C7D|nr:glycosyltransferase [Baekduia alba]